MNGSERGQAILRRLAAMGNVSAAPRQIPTGLRTLDEALGGGFPRGRIVEFFGPSGSGKTTLALQAIAHLQGAGLNAAFIDADHTFDAAYAYSLSVAVEGLPLAQPSNAEQAMGIARSLTSSGAVDLIVIDSAAALAPQLEVEGGLIGIPRLQSRVLGTELRKLNLALRRSEACVLFLNQMRSRPDRGAGEAETSAGGPPLKLYASVRIVMLPTGGSRLRLRVLKNNAAEGASGRELEWRTGSGFVSVT